MPDTSDFRARSVQDVSVDGAGGVVSVEGAAILDYVMLDFIDDFLLPEKEGTEDNDPFH